jgi:hypothetical protein
MALPRMVQDPFQGSFLQSMQVLCHLLGMYRRCFQGSFFRTHQWPASPDYSRQQQDMYGIGLAPDL